jgi:L-asparaginase
LVIYTGGTIGMMEDPETGSLKPFDFEHLTELMPELNRLNCDIDSVAFEDHMDSSNMHPEIWLRIAKIIERHYASHDGFVVLHGSDTMAYTASGLSFALENLSKPVILTGSQLPMGVLRTDGKENFITAIEIASDRDEVGHPRVPEVAVYFEYKLLRGNRTTKYSAESFEAFQSPNYPILAEAGVHIRYNIPYIYKPNPNKPLVINEAHNTAVGVIHLFPGISEEAIAPILLNPNLKGVVLKTFGAGNAPTAKWFIDLLRQATLNDTVIYNVTQCQTGAVEHGKYETSVSMDQLGVVSGSDITTEAAITKLMYLLGFGFKKEQIEYYLSCSLRGEITVPHGEKTSEVRS